MSPLLVKTFVIWLYAGVLSGCLAIRTVFVTQYVTNWLKVEVKPNSVILILCTFHFVNHHISDRQIHEVNPPPGFHFACPQIRNQLYPLLVPPSISKTLDLPAILINFHMQMHDKFTKLHCHC